MSFSLVFCELLDFYFIAREGFMKFTISRKGNIGFMSSATAELDCANF